MNYPHTYFKEVMIAVGIFTMLLVFALVVWNILPTKHTCSYCYEGFNEKGTDIGGGLIFDNRCWTELWKCSGIAYRQYLKEINAPQEDIDWASETTCAWRVNWIREFMKGREK